MDEIKMKIKMKMYQSKNQVKAFPMSRHDYNQYRGADIYKTEDLIVAGYLVEDIDFGFRNHPDHDGFIDWCSKENKMNKNKVNIKQVQAMMESLTYEFARIGDSTTTVCEAFLPNGFSVGSGKSACVDPNSFDYELGCKYAKENAEIEAKKTIWQLEGYLLKVTGKTSEDF